MSIQIEDLERWVNNPNRGIAHLTNELETSIFETPVKINSASHPFIYASDMIVGTAHALHNRIADAVSNMYPVHARTISQLSRHMADDERAGMFATPSTTVLEYAISEDVFKSLAKEYTVTQGNASFTYQMLLIPKDTEITYSGYTYCVENGIEIRYSEETGYQTVYDESTNNPVNPISNNLLQKEQRQGQNTWYLVVTVPVRQIKARVTGSLTSNQATGCIGQVVYEDFLYNIRAFLTQNGVKQELLVTYNQAVFNPMTPTLAIELDTGNNMYKYEIPDVYITNGLGIGTVDIYTYSTKGELIGKNFSQVPAKEVGVNYQDYRYAGGLGPFSGGLRDSGGMTWKAIQITAGGGNAKNFEEIKQNFILGRRHSVLPITENNLSGTVQSYGYSSVKAIDYMTKRSYSITKELPQPSNKKFYSPMSCYVGSHLASANDLVRSGVVLDNGQRVTIPHNVLFDITQPTAVLVPQYTKEGYFALSSELKVDLITERTLTYTPFYYVLDTTNKQAVLRTYHLDAPVFNYQTFQAENTALGMEVGVGQIGIEHRDDGYLITLITKSGNSYKELDNESLGVQLTFTPMDSNTPANMKGTLYGETDDGERIWQFKISSNFDIDVNDVLYVNGFNQYGNVANNLGTELTMNATLLFLYQGTNGGDPTDSDRKVDPSLYPDPMLAIIETLYNITFGKALNNLYSRIRPLVGEAQYKRYPADVPETYTETTYLKEDGEMVIVDGKAVIEHRAGEIVYNSDGSMRLKARAGWVMYDENEQPIVLEPRDLQYHFDFIGFDGAYLFTGDDYDKDFAQETKNLFLNVIGTDMDFFNSMSIDQTAMSYQPRNKLGYQKVVINSNAQTYLKQDLSFVVTYYLTKAGNKNAPLKEALRESSPRTINGWLYGASTTANSDLIAALRAAASSPEVKAIRVDAFAGNTLIDVISNADQLSGFSVRKELQLTSDGLLSIKEAVEVGFEPHDVSMVNLGSF